MIEDFTVADSIYNAVRYGLLSPTNRAGSGGPGGGDGDVRAGRSRARVFNAVFLTPALPVLARLTTSSWGRRRLWHRVG